MKWLRVALLGLFLLFTVRAEDTLVVHLDKYVVQPGDYLSKIEQSYSGINWEDIYNLNEVTVGKNPHLIYPDSTLYIPVGSSYIKKAEREINYHLQIWVLVTLVAIFIYIYKRKTMPTPVINVQEPRSGFIKGQAPPSLRDPQVGEISIEEAPSWSPANDPQPTEVGLSPEKINTSADNKLDLEKLKKIRK